MPTKQYAIIILYGLVATLISVAQDTRQKPMIGRQDKNLSGEISTVDQVLDKYTHALGGAAAFRKLNIRVLKGTVEFVTEGGIASGNSEIYAVAPNKRLEMIRIKKDECHEGEIMEWFNGTVGWSSWDQIRKLEGAELAAKKLEAEFYPEIKHKKLYPKMSFSGTERVGDYQTYVLDAMTAEGNPERMYFDVQTGLLVRRDMTKYISGRAVAFQLSLEDYREIDGVKLPFTFRFLSPAVKVFYKFNEIKHNVTIEGAIMNSLNPALASFLSDPRIDVYVQPGSVIAPTTDKYIQVEMKKRCIPGLALVVIKNGKVVKMNGFGFASLENNAPVTPDTVFDLASVTKQITATAIMLLVEQGKIKLDDPIIQYLPSSPNQWKWITIRHLLTHTAGLSEIGFHGSDQTIEGMFTSVSAMSLKFLPGSEYLYSSGGYFLLGMIIEKASGLRYKDFLAEKFFKPLGMTSTYVLDHSATVKDSAAGYVLRDGKPSYWRHVWQDKLPSSHGVLSTVRDMAKWDIALKRGKLVKELSLAVMWTPVKLNDGSSYPYGLGWDIKQFFGRRMITHTGYTGTEYTILPDDQLTVIVLTNLGGLSANSTGIAQGVALRYLSNLP